MTDERAWVQRQSANNAVLETSPQTDIKNALLSRWVFFCLVAKSACSGYAPFVRCSVKMRTWEPKAALENCCQFTKSCRAKRYFWTSQSRNTQDLRRRHAIRFRRLVANVKEAALRLELVRHSRQSVSQILWIYFANPFGKESAEDVRNPRKLTHISIGDWDSSTAILLKGGSLAMLHSDMQTTIQNGAFGAP